jgi:thiol-disulfide isomerase/thioredoxin
MKTVFRAGLGQLCLVLLVLLGRCTTEPEKTEYIAPQELAPDFIIDLGSSNPLHLRGLRGKVVVLCFMIHYLEPCRKLHYFLQQIGTDYQAAQIVFLEIEKQGESVPNRAVKTDSLFYLVPDDGTVYTRYTVKRVPTTIILDQAGKEVYRHEGFHQRSTGIQGIVKKLDELL